MDAGNKALGDLVNALTPDAPTTFSLALLRKDCGQLGTNFKGFGKRGDTRGTTYRNHGTYPHGDVQAEALRLIPICPCASSKSCECGPVLKPKIHVAKPQTDLADPLGSTRMNLNLSLNDTSGNTFGMLGGLALGAFALWYIGKR